MPDNATLYLARIADSLDAIENHLSGVDRETFLVNVLVPDGVSMRPQIIGESAARLNEAERGEAPDIPWSRIVGLRHRISHNYMTVDFTVVWTIVSTELAPLRAAVQRMLNARGE